ncbi:MAG: tRNA lysidine(34) synthetase TilS [Bariatricus sp.]|nr:tRNA lysidine(34) synthetase TilS [Bariatricus sp.]
MQVKVKEFMKKWHMLTAGDTVIAGVSGGADSMCLLFVLEELRKSMGFELVVVHVNHGIRGEAADADESYVKEVCDKMKIPCEIFHVDVPKYSRKEKLSEEEAGRELRRKAFRDTLQKYQGTKIALAHHQDDNAETFFLHLARGSKIRGLGGICPVKGNYIRPLLCVSRREIEKFLEKKGILYCMDATNLEDTYTRNRIRKHIIPYFTENINSRTVEHINGAMEQLREIEEYLQRQMKAAYKQCVKEEPGKLHINKKELRCQDDLICGMLLRQAMAGMCGKEKDLEEIHVTKLKELMDMQTGRRIDLPYRMHAVRTYEGIDLLLDEQKADESKEMGMVEEEICLSDLNFEKEMTITYGKWVVTCRKLPIELRLDRIPKKTYTKWFDYDIIKENVFIRTRRAGDRIVIDEEGKSKKLKSYLIDEKIPADKRDEIPLIAEKNQILWIVGYRQSKAYQVTKQTKTVLEITINGGTLYGRED